MWENDKGLTPYHYSYNNPINQSDPSGMQTIGLPIPLPLPPPMPLPVAQNLVTKLKALDNIVYNGITNFLNSHLYSNGERTRTNPMAAVSTSTSSGEEPKEPNPEKFNSKQDSESETISESFGKAKDRNGIPKSQQPETTEQVPDKARPGKKIREFQFINSYGEKVSIRRDTPKKYGAPDGKGDPEDHHNAGQTGEKLDQHHNLKKPGK